MILAALIALAAQPAELAPVPWQVTWDHDFRCQRVKNRAGEFRVDGSVEVRRTERIIKTSLELRLNDENVIKRRDGTSWFKVGLREKDWTFRTSKNEYEGFDPKAGAWVIRNLVFRVSMAPSPRSDSEVASVAIFRETTTSGVPPHQATKLEPIGETTCPLKLRQATS